MKFNYLKTGNKFCESRDLKDHGEISYQLLTHFTESNRDKSSTNKLLLGLVRGGP